MLDKVLGLFERMGSLFASLPLVHRLAITGVGGAIALTLLWLSDSLRSIVVPAAITMVLVIGFLVLVQFIVRAMERKKNASLSDALERDSREESLLSDEERKEALAEIHDQWGKALSELKNYGLNVYSMPWFMLIGEPASGKTTTLRNSGLEFPIATEALSGFGGTRNCDWWFTNEAVILDTAGRFTFDERNAPDADQWREFLDLLKRYRPRCPINGVLVTIPATSLLEDSPEEQERKAKNIRDKLTELEQVLEIQFPVFVLVTKCDLVMGFAEFFHRLPALEQRQLFGWSKPHPYEEPFPASRWPEVFESLHGTLRRWRNRFLEDDPDSGDVDRLYAYPEEFRALEAPLTRYMTEMFVENRYMDPLYLRGLYFTSGLQKGRPIDTACANLFHASGSAGDMDEALFEQSTAFFIRDFYRKKLFIEQGLIQPTRIAKRRRRILERTAYAIGGTLCAALLTMLVWGALQQSKGVVDPRDLLQELQASVASWDRSSFPVAALHKGMKFTATIRGIHEREELAKPLGGDAPVRELMTDLARADTKLLNDSVFRHFAEQLDLAFQWTPDTYEDYLTYKEALLGYLYLARVTSQGAISDEERTQSQKSWDAVVDLVELRTRESGTITTEQLGQYRQLYQDLLEISFQIGIEWPSLRDSLRPDKERFRRMLQHLVDYMINTAQGDPTLEGLAEDDLYSSGTWLRILALTEQLKKDHTTLRSSLSPPYATLAEGRAALRKWCTVAAGEGSFLADVAELRELCKNSQARHLREHGAAVNLLVERFEGTFESILSLVEKERELPALVAEQKRRVGDEFRKPTAAVRSALLDNRSPYAVLTPEKVATDGMDRYSVTFDESGFGVDSSLIQTCVEAIRSQAQEPMDPVNRKNWHLELRARLDGLQTATAFTEVQLAQREQLASELTPALQTARGVLLTTVLEEHREFLSNKANRADFVATLIPDRTPDRIQFGKRRTPIEKRYRGVVATQLLGHLDGLLRLSDDPQLERLMMDQVRADSQKTFGEVATDYISGYRKAWKAAQAAFKPVLSGKPEWNAFTDDFDIGFGGLAHDGSAVGEAFQQLIDVIRSNINEVASYGQRNDVHVVLSDVVRSEIAIPFRKFLRAYGPPEKDGEVDRAKLVASDYASFALAVARLGRLRKDDREEFFEGLFAVEAKGEKTRAELLTACEHTILRGDLADLLSDEPITVELLNVVQAGRRAIETEAKAGFELEWEKIRVDCHTRITDKFPFAAHDSWANAKDVQRQDFKRLYTNVKALERRWWRFFENPDQVHIQLQLERPRIKVFCDNVIGWGKMIGFEGGNLKMDNVRLHVNHKAEVVAESNPFVDAARTRIEVDVGNRNLDIRFGIGDSDETFAWDFMSNPPVHFELHDRSGNLDPGTVWPPENEHPTSWLALPRILLAHCADGWPRENRHQWLVWAAFDFDNEKHVIYHKFTLPDGRSLPERPSLADTGWE